jgi:hypothetical protein
LPGSSLHIDTRGAGWLVRTLDVLVLVLSAVTVLVAAFGGFRIRAGVVSVSATDPWRMLFLTVALGVARHWRVRRPSLWSRLVAGISALRRSQAAGAASRVWLASQLAVLFTGYLATSMVGPLDTVPRLSENAFWNLPARGESLRYLAVALDGYRDRQGSVSNLDIFPAYPLLMRTGGTLLGTRLYVGGTFEDPFQGKTLVAGLLIALAAFLGALMYLYRLARHDLSHEQATIVIVLAATYPFAFRFSLVAADSLLLLAAVAACDAARRGRWIGAACWGLAGGLSHTMGWLMAIPLVAFAARDNRGSGPARLAAAAAPVLGLLLFSAFCFQTTNDALSWWESGKRGAGWSGIFSHPLAYFHLAGAAVTLLVVPGVARRWPVAYFTYVLGGLLLVFARGPEAMGPATAQLFPIFFALAASPHGRLPWFLPAFALTQGFLVVVHYTGRTGL